MISRLMRYGLGTVLAIPVALWGQAPATFTPNALNLTGFKTTVHMTVTSPYDDCTMAITVRVSDPTIATISPAGPVISLGPVTFTVTTGTKAGSSSIIFLISGDPGGCVSPTSYSIPITVKDVPGGTPPTGTYGKQVIEPISMATGALINDWSDLRLRGPLPIEFTRHYDSTIAAVGRVSSALGPNWMHSFDLSLKLNGSTAAVSWYDGDSITFTSSGGQWTQSSTNPFIYQMVQSGTSYLLLDPSSQYVYAFDGASGHLQSIQDRNGNTQTLTYSNNLLSHISDGLGGTLDLTYTGANLTKVVDQSDRSISFAYSGGNLTSFTDAAGKVTTYAYGSSGGMTSSTEPRGNVPYAETYDSTGKVSTQTDAAGNTTKFNVGTDASGTGPASMTNPLGQVSNYSHTAGELILETDPAGDSNSTTYDANGRPLTLTDASGNVTAYGYHSATGLVASTTNPDGGRATYSYSSSTAGGFTFFDLTGITYPDGTTESFQYDTNGNVLSRIDRNGKQYSATYNSHGQMLTLTDPLGATTTWTYTQDGTSAPATVKQPDTSVITLAVDALKRLVGAQNADSTAQSFTWDANDRLLSATDENGNVTRYTWDANGLRSSVTAADGGQTKLTYTGTDKLATATDAAGRTATLSYDSVDRSSKTTLGDGSSTQVTYDAAGNISTIVDAVGKSWKRSWSKTGFLTSAVSPVGPGINLTLDSMNRAVSSQTTGGKQNAFAYDRMSRLTAITDSLQHQFVYSYDKNGLMTGVTAPGGLSTKITRDAAGRITSVADPAGNAWTNTFDGSGRILSTTDPLGRTKSFARDGRGRVSQITMPLGTVSVALDGVGNLKHLVYSDSNTFDYDWDAVGRLTFGSGLSFQYDASGALKNTNGISVVHDAANRVSQVGLAAGKSVSYSYDPRGLVTQVSDWLGGSTTMRYDDNGRLTAIVRPNGVTTSFTYDADSDLASITETAGSTLSSIALTRDQRGFVSQAVRSVPLSPTTAQVAAAQSLHTFDAAGQIGEFKYDAMGRRTSDDTRSYTWDLASHLTSYAAGSNSASITWNGLDLPSSITQGAVTRQLVWNFAFDLPSVSVTRTATADLAYYIHTPDGKLLYSVDAGGSRHFYHYDEMGNTIFLTDGSGAITDKYAWSDYGAQLAVTGATDNLFQWGGRDGVLQLGNGLSINRLRVYDSRSATFLSPDPNARPAPRLLNPYEYAAGNPLLFRDPVGADPGNGATGSATANAPDVTGASGPGAFVSGTPLFQGYVFTPIQFQNVIPTTFGGVPMPAGPPITIVLNLQPVPPINLNPGAPLPFGVGPLGGPSTPGQGLFLTGGNLNVYPGPGTSIIPVAPIATPVASGSPVGQAQTEAQHAPASSGGGSGQTQNSLDRPHDKQWYEDIKARIINLYRKGRISAAQRKTLLGYAEQVYREDGAKK